MKRYFAFLVFLAMTMSLLLTGCSNSAAPSAPGTAASAETASTGAATEAAAPTNQPTVTIHVFAIQNSLSDKYETFPVMQKCEQDAHVKLQWEYVDENGYADKKNLMLSSGELPDLIFMGGLSDADISGNQGAFLPLEDLISKDGPNIQKMFDLEPTTKIMCTASDGHIYSLPHVMPLRPSTFDMAFLNQDWLTSLQLPMPQTTDDFYNVLTAFKTKDPNQNGKADEIPFSIVNWGADGLFGIGSLMGAFGIVGDFSGNMVMVKNGTVEFWPTMDGYKQAVRYFNKLYSEGLLDSESFTQDWDKAQAKMQNPDVELVGGSIQWTIENVIGVKYEKSYTVMPPLKGPNGDQYWRSNDVEVRFGKNYATITTKASDPEAIMRFLNLIYDQENSLQLFYGPIPTSIQKNSDGTYLVLPPPEGMTAGEWQWKNSFGDSGPMFVSREFEKLLTPPQDIVGKLDAEEVYSPYYVKENYPPIFWDSETQDTLSVLKTDINKYVNEQFASWIVKGGIDGEWDAYQAELDKMGLSKLMEIYSKGYSDSKNIK